MLFSKATMKIGDSTLMKGVGPFTNKVGFIPSMEGFILHHPSSVNNSSRNDINNHQIHINHHYILGSRKKCSRAIKHHSIKSMVIHQYQTNIHYIITLQSSIMITFNSPIT
jgi:hypothetical protein